MNRFIDAGSKSNEINHQKSARLQDQRNIHITLKQWRAFHAVVNSGGYLDAAESLHLSQSTISYMLNKLQQQLGISLMKIEGRKAILTEEGKILLERSRSLLKDAAQLELLAESLRAGKENEVRVAIHPDFPVSYFSCVLHKLRQSGKKIEVALTQLSQRRAAEALRDRRADIAITSSPPPGFVAQRLHEVEYSIVMHAGHLLVRSRRPIRLADLRQEVEVTLLEGEQDLISEPDGRIESKRWALASLEAAVGVLGSGIGYAHLPTHRVQSWIERGILAAITTDELERRKVFYLAYPGSIRTASTEQRLVQALLAAGSQ